MHSVTLQQGVYLGFDFGTKHLGIAVGQTITQSANPLITLKANKGVPNWNQIGLLIKEWQPKGLIVGLPLQLDGTASSTSHLAMLFAKRLGKHFSLPIHLIEERLTSVAANQRLKELRPLKTAYHTQDAMAAAIILESWFHQVSKENAAYVCEESAV